MIFHENCLLADDSHVISCLIFFLKIRKDVAKFIVCGALRVNDQALSACGFWGNESLLFQLILSF